MRQRSRRRGHPGPLIWRRAIRPPPQELQAHIARNLSSKILALLNFKWIEGHAAIRMCCIAWATLNVISARMLAITFRLRVSGAIDSSVAEILQSDALRKCRPQSHRRLLVKTDRHLT